MGNGTRHLAMKPVRGTIIGSMYSQNDKIMLLATGEVLTVIRDFSDELERGIVVRENIGRNLMTSEVRPAGHTRAGSRPLLARHAGDDPG